MPPTGRSTIEEEFQSTHPMRGATNVGSAFEHQRGISIHAPHAGCDSQAAACIKTSQPFQSTHPMRGATRFRPRPHLRPNNFNPRTPCGVRPPMMMMRFLVIKFQSTHPMRGATLSAPGRSPACQNFNPRTPCGVRLPVGNAMGKFPDISIHAPHAGCDVK